MEVIIALVSNPKFWGVVASLIAIIAGIYYQFLSERARKKREEKARLKTDAKKEQELDGTYRNEQVAKKKSRDSQKRVAEEWNGHNDPKRN